MFPPQASRGNLEAAGQGFYSATVRLRCDRATPAPGSPPAALGLALIRALHANQQPLRVMLLLRLLLICCERSLCPEVLAFAAGFRVGLTDPALCWESFIVRIVIAIPIAHCWTAATVAAVVAAAANTCDAAMSECQPARQ